MNKEIYDTIMMELRRSPNMTELRVYVQNLHPEYRKTMTTEIKNRADELMSDRTASQPVAEPKTSQAQKKATYNHRKDKTRLEILIEPKTAESYKTAKELSGLTHDEFLTLMINTFLDENIKKNRPLEGGKKNKKAD